jgi:hypothetical protein
MSCEFGEEPAEEPRAKSSVYVESADPFNVQYKEDLTKMTWNVVHVLIKLLHHRLFK